jgi:transcription elongation factor Elf1
MTDILVIACTCLRCGFQNQVTIGLTNKKDTAVYKCDNCNFIIISSWMQEE